MRRFLIYYLYFTAIIYTLNDERFLAIYQPWFWRNCHENPTNFYFFLMASMVALALIIYTPRIRLQGNKLKVPVHQIEINIIGIIPYFQTLFLYRIISSWLEANRQNLRPKFDKPPTKIFFFILAVLIIMLFIVLILGVLIGFFTFLLFSICPIFLIFEMFHSVSPKISTFITTSQIIMMPLKALLTIISISFNAAHTFFNPDYGESRHIQYTLDTKNKVLKPVKGPKGDIPLHTLNSFRRHSFYPTGIIHNNSDLLNVPTIDWRIETNEGIGTTDELINYLNDLILKAKIEENDRVKKENELIQLIENN